LRITRGPQFDWFADEAHRALTSGEFAVSEDSNRLGLRLNGPRLAARGNAEMISEGTPLGAIQVTASGQAIVLFVEQQTTGGYPKIANVIGADLHSVGQLRPRDAIRFEEVSLGAARELWIEQTEVAGFRGAALRMKRVDLNCDMGELPEMLANGSQEALMKFVTSVNVACGGPRGR